MTGERFKGQPRFILKIAVKMVCMWCACAFVRRDAYYCILTDDISRIL